MVTENTTLTEYIYAGIVTPYALGIALTLIVSNGCFIKQILKRKQHCKVLMSPLEAWEKQKQNLKINVHEEFEQDQSGHGNVLSNHDSDPPLENPGTNDATPTANGIAICEVHIDISAHNFPQNATPANPPGQTELLANRVLTAMSQLENLREDQSLHITPTTDTIDSLEAIPTDQDTVDAAVEAADAVTSSLRKETSGTEVHEVILQQYNLVGSAFQKKCPIQSL